MNKGLLFDTCLFVVSLLFPVFVDYDSWDNVENPEGEMAQGRLRQIQVRRKKGPSV